jgi:hypothetical protein
LLISASAIEGHFEVKTPRECHQGVLFLQDNAPAHRAFVTQNKLAYLCFECLDYPLYSPELAPSDYQLFPELKKKTIAIFRPTWRSMLPRKPGWTDNILIF